MRQRLALFSLSLALAGAGWAQHGGAATMGGAARSGFGNVVFPGTGHAPAVMPGQVLRNPFSITDTGFAQRLGQTVSGFYPKAPSHGNRSVVVVPYAYPVAVPYPYMPDPQAAPNITIVNTPPQSPQVIVNQNYIPETASPVIREYPQGGPEMTVYQAPSGAAPSESSSPEQSRSYLIAFKDHSIYSALAYWVEGDTLHYVTSSGVHNQASLDLIDRDFTAQLNRRRDMQVKLPSR